MRITKILAIGLIVITAIIIFKYKPLYKVTIDGEEIGYVKNIDQIQNGICAYMNTDDKDIIYGMSRIMQSYDLEFVSNNAEEIEEKEVLNYIIAKVESVNEESTQIIAEENQIEQKEENIEVKEVVEIAQTIDSPSTENNEVKVSSRSTEKSRYEKEEEKEESKEETEEVSEEEDYEEQEEEDASVNEVIDVNGVNFSVYPVTGRISSKFGVVSSIRSGAHTGLDIAVSRGTPIKVAASGTVTFAGYSGSYGNLVKVSHGSGVETWYAHCNAIYVSEGDYLVAGDVLGEVGSTGNATGPHLHLEIRIDGTPVNPQNYMY